MVEDFVIDFNRELDKKNLDSYLWLEKSTNGFTEIVQVPEILVFSSGDVSSKFVRQTSLGNIFVYCKALLDVAKKQLEKELDKFFETALEKIRVKGFDTSRIRYELSESGKVYMTLPEEEDLISFVNTLNLEVEFSYIFGDLKLITYIYGREE